jgi:hypothetical protein
MKTTKDVSGTKALIQFKITLSESSPRIWRRIVVPKSYSFFDLHVAIQNSMGWLDSHLHAFTISQKGTTTPISIQFPDPENDEMFGQNENLDERYEKIADYFGKRIKQSQYTYDFGDSWDHIVLFEREMIADPMVTYPKCIAGENACPPDDCGGLGGYDRLQMIMQDSSHPEHKDMLDWLGIDHSTQFRPTEFDPEEVVFEDPRERQKEYEEGFGVTH